MQKLIDLMNELSEKYKFDEADVKRIQEAVFQIENGEGAISSADLDKEDFVKPEGFEEEEDGLSDDV